MGSGVFLAIVVVLWFVVLVPMVLNRGEAAREAALGEELSPSARILTRRSSSAHTPRRFVSMSRRESSPSLDDSDQSDEQSAQLEDDVQTGTFARYDDSDQVDTGVHARYVDDGPEPQVSDAPRAVDHDRPRRTDAAREMMLVRRRRTLIALTVLTVVTLAMSVFLSPMLWIAQVIVDLALIGYLSHLRGEASRERERAEQREARMAPRQRSQASFEGTYSEQRSATAAVYDAPAQDQSVVRIDDEDPAFYDLGDTPVASKADLRGGYTSGRSSYEDYSSYDDYDDGWDERKAV